MNVLTFLLTLVVFVFFIGLFVIAHELGHFFFARRAGILCHEFAVGMGPVIYKKKKGETTYTIRLLPIGGFVQMATDLMPSDYVKEGKQIGINLDQGSISHIVVNDNVSADKTGYVVDFDLSGSNEEQLFISLKNEDKITRYPVLNNAHYVLSNSEQIQISPYNRTFESKTVGQRALTLVFGPIMNFVAALVIYFLFWSVFGVPNQSSNIIGDVLSNNPAYEYLLPGDEILSINGNVVEAWSNEKNSVGEIMNRLAPTGVEYLDFVIRRNGVIIGSDESNPLRIYNNIIINSVGLSNLQVDRSLNSDKGIVVGNVIHNFVGGSPVNQPQMTNGDVLLAIQVRNLIAGTNNFEPLSDDGWVDVTDWSMLVRMFTQIDIAWIHYRFIPQATTQVIETTAPVETFGTELLTNQRVRNIIITVGITPEVHRNVFSIIGSAFSSFLSDFTSIFRTLQIMIAPSGFRQVGITDLSGPVGIFQIIESRLQAGILPLLSFVALLSVNFGVLNLLPIPALDGGRLVFIGYEAVTRKKVNKNFEIVITNIIFILLMLLMLVVTFNDILRIFG